MRKMFVTLSNGIRVFYQERGEGKPVVLIHHLAGSINSWKYVFPVLTEKYRVIEYDLRGHGRSSIITEPYKIEDHSEDLKLLLEELNVKDPILVGHSIGTLIAIDYALHNQVDKLVLIGALYKAPNPEPYEKYVSIAMSLGMEALAEFRRRQGEFSSKLLERGWQDLLQVYKETTPIGYKYAVEGLLSARDYSNDIEKIDNEVLIIYGEEDKLSSNLPVFQDKIKRLKTQILKGYGHYLNFEGPEDLTKLIIDFVR